MKNLFTISLALCSLNLSAQQWQGSSDINNVIDRNGNIKVNGLSLGRVGGPLSGDPNPYQIYTGGNEAHDLIFYGNSEATLNLRLYDGDLKIGNNIIPTSILYNNGNASFGGLVGIRTTDPPGCFTCKCDQAGNHYK